MSAYSRSIRDLILDFDYNIDDIDELLEESYNEVIEGMFSALFFLLKCYSHNQDRICDLLNKIEEICDNERDYENFIFINNCIKNILGNINGVLDRHQKKDVHCIVSRLSRLSRLVFEEGKDIICDNRFKLFEYLICIDRNISRVNLMLDNYSDILKSVDENGHDIFYNILDIYVRLEENDTEEINYFYKVILLFINNRINDISNNRVLYLTVLNNPIYICKKHVAEVINKFQDAYTVPVSELESKYRVSLVYPKSIEKELEDFKVDESGYDFSKQKIITIDKDSDRCLDDGLFMERNKDGTYTLFVHITSVSSLVPFNSDIFKEAMKREETLYLTDRVIPMYPEKISDDLCSLLPNKNRSAFSYAIWLDSNFDVIGFKIIKGRINVFQRMSYDEVDKMLGSGGNSSLDGMLFDLSEFSMRQRKLNKAKDKYRNEENIINPKDHHQSMRTDYSRSANIVQESMIMVNHLAPKYFYENGWPYLNRFLHFSRADSLTQEMDSFLLRSGIFLDSIEKQKLLKVLTYVNSMARYSVHEHGHEGLGLDFYSHTSSAARRGSDSLCQYVTDDIVFNGNTNDSNLYFWENTLNNWANYFNERKIINVAFSNQYNYLSSKKLLKMK